MPLPQRLNLYNYVALEVHQKEKIHSSPEIIQQGRYLYNITGYRVLMPNNEMADLYFHILEDLSVIGCDGVDATCAMKLLETKEMIYGIWENKEPEFLESIENYKKTKAKRDLFG